MAAQNMTEGASTGSATRTGRNWVTGTFTDRDSADRAYNSILSRGYSEKEINLLMSDETRKRYFSDEKATDSELGNKAMESAGVGGAIGVTAVAILAAVAAIGTSIAFHVGHVVPGIDFSNDPLLQGRLFSYTDTQLIRLGGPNFHEIPINRPVAPVHNNQRDGHMRQTINRSRASYEPNSIGGGCPFQAGGDMGGFTSYAEKIDASKVRARSESYFDHFSQATMFYRSQSEPEQNHIVKALRFELGKLEIPAIKERMVGLLSLVDQTLASHAAEGLGLSVPAEITPPINHSIPADGPADSDVARFQPKRPKKSDAVGAISPALSMANTPKDSIKTRKVAFLVADGFDDAAVLNMAKAIEAAGPMAKFVAPRGGTLQGAKGKELTVDFSLLTTSSAIFDAVYVPGGAESVKTLLREAEAIHFINEAYKHCKTIAATGEGIDLLRASYAGGKRQVGEGAKNLPTLAGDGIIVSLALDAHKVANDFIAAIAQHRHWSRRQKGNVPA
jgi:catalase